MTFERSTDYALIRSILTHPKVWDRITDDYAPVMEVWEPPQGEGRMYVVARDGEEVLGLWMFDAHSVIVLECHTCLLPSCGHKRAIQAAKEMAQWIWENTACVRLVTGVPEYNTVASNFALAAGMTPYGNNFKSVQKGEILWDQHLFGMSRPIEAVAA